MQNVGLHSSLLCFLSSIMTAARLLVRTEKQVLVLGASHSSAPKAAHFKYIKILRLAQKQRRCKHSCNGSEFYLENAIRNIILREWRTGWLSSLRFPPKHHHSPLCWLPPWLNYRTDGGRETKRWRIIFALRYMEWERYLVVRRGGDVFWWVGRTDGGGVMIGRKWWNNKGARWWNGAERRHFHLTFIADCYAHIELLCLFLSLTHTYSSAKCAAPKITST